MEGTIAELKTRLTATVAPPGSTVVLVATEPLPEAALDEIATMLRQLHDASVCFFVLAGPPLAVAEVRLPAGTPRTHDFV